MGTGGRHNRRWPLAPVALRRKADEIRRAVVEVAVRNQAGHIAPSLSCVEILVALYYGVMEYRPAHPQWASRDRLIFSKAHGGYALYAILADVGMLPASAWQKFYTVAGTLPGCVERRVEYGLEAGCGSLGHGLPIAVGLAFGASRQRRSFHTFCVMGDGEMQEGTTWEALQFAVKHRLGNLTVVIDDNRLQAMDFVTGILDRTEEDKIHRLRGFGLSPRRCPGHQVAGLARALAAAKRSPGEVPSVIVATTIKGFGLACMENIPKFHFRIPTERELRQGRGRARTT